MTRSQLLSEIFRKFATMRVGDFIRFLMVELKIDVGDNENVTVDFHKQFSDLSDKAWKVYYTEGYNTFAQWIAETFSNVVDFIFSLKEDDLFTAGGVWYVDKPFEKKESQSQNQSK